MRSCKYNAGDPMTEKGQVIEHDDGSADIIWYDKSPSGYPRPCVMQLTKREYNKYKKVNGDYSTTKD